MYVSNGKLKEHSLCYYKSKSFVALISYLRSNKTKLLDHAKNRKQDHNSILFIYLFFSSKQRLNRSTTSFHGILNMYQHFKVTFSRTSLAQFSLIAAFSSFFICLHSKSRNLRHRALMDCHKFASLRCMYGP